MGVRGILDAASGRVDLVKPCSKAHKKEPGRVISLLYSRRTAQLTQQVDPRILRCHSSN